MIKEYIISLGMKKTLLFVKKILSFLLIGTMIQGFFSVSFSVNPGISEHSIVMAKGIDGKTSLGMKSQKVTRMETREKNTAENKILGVQVEVATGTIVSEKGGDMQVVDTFLKDPNSVVSLKDEVFQLGYADKYLYFSKPVKLTFSTQFKRGKSVKPLVKHFGDTEYNTFGLTTNPNVVCNNGEARDEIFEEVIVGKNGILEFYTCGASTFIIDDIGTTPAGAYGLRKLNDSYSGSLIRVRRSSDNTETDIGFGSANLAQNRTFTSDTLWNKGTGVTISGGLVSASGSTRIINQDMGLVSGRTYRVTILANKTGVLGVSRIRINTSSSLTTEGTNNVTQSANPANGSQVIQLDITANNPILSIAADTTEWSGTISLVSVQDITNGVTRNDLDEAALLAFAGTGSAFVRTWYDQSGNGRNVSNTDTTQQPRIVNAGVLDIISNGRPGIRFLGNNIRLVASAAPFSSANEFMVNMVHQETVRTANVGWSLNASASRVFAHLPWSNGTIYFDVGGCCNVPQRLQFGSPFSVGSTNIYTFTNSVSANQKIVFGNGNSIGSGPAAAGSVNELQIGGTPGLGINGLISEFIVFGTVPTTAQRKIIEQSQASYFGLGGSYIPESPTSLASVSGVSQVGLTWVPPSYIGGSAITDYQIEFKPSTGTLWTIWNDGISTATGTTVTGLTNMVSYDFRVSATNANGTGTPSTIKSETPQAITGLSLWLRSDRGIVSSGSSVSQWKDQSGRSNTTTQTNSANQPTLTQDAINFNPAITFTAANSTRLEGTFATRFTGTDMTALTVALPDTNNGSFVGLMSVWNSTGTNKDWDNTEAGVILARYGADNKVGSERQNIHHNTLNLLGRVSLYGTQFGPTTASMRTNGRITAGGSIPGGAFNSDRYVIGSRFINTYSDFSNSRFAETLVYNKILSPTEYNRAESYLALKYGISLDQTTATNYTLSDGSMAWNSLGVANYKNDITGIARDDGFGLNQVKSQSINNTTDIIVEDLSLPLTDRTALIWAHDGTSTGTFINSEKPANITNRISREWQFQELLGDTGNVKISYPTTALPVGFTGTLYMLVDTDGDFGNGGTTTLTGTLVSGNWEFQTNMINGNDITFGQIDMTAPTIGSFSILSGALIPTSAQTININYSDTGGSLINTATFTRQLLKWNGTLWNDVTSSSITGTTTSQTGASVSTNKLSFGKYRLDTSVSDNAGNISTTGSTTFYIDEPEINVSTGSINMGVIGYNNNNFSAGEIIVTIKTVGAGFSLNLNQNTELSEISGQTIPRWNGTQGFGYQPFPYAGNILAIDSGSSNLLIQPASINTDGNKNTYTFTLKPGAKFTDQWQAAGDYITSLGFTTQFNY